MNSLLIYFILFDNIIPCKKYYRMRSFQFWLQPVYVFFWQSLIAAQFDPWDFLSDVAISRSCEQTYLASTHHFVL